LVLGLVALLAGILALNGVIQAAGSPSRTAGTDLDTTSVLPPPAAAEAPAEPAGAPAAEVAVAETPTEVVRSAAARPAPAAPPRPAPRAGAGSPAGTPAARGTPAASRRSAAVAPVERAGAAEPDNAGAPAANDAGDGSASDALRTGDDGAQAGIASNSARDRSDRPGRSGLLTDLGCTVEGVQVNDQPLVSTGCR
jgi:hypothetical protein